MKKIMIGISAMLLLASAAVYANRSSTKADCCAQGSSCCYAGSPCCHK